MKEQTDETELEGGEGTVDTMQSRDYRYCTRHDEYLANPKAKVCGACGDLIIREKPQPSRLLSLLVGVGLGLTSLAVSASYISRNIEIPQTYTEISGLTREEQITILDRNNNNKIDAYEQENLVVRLGELYLKGGTENYDRK